VLGKATGADRLGRAEQSKQRACFVANEGERGGSVKQGDQMAGQ